MGIDTNLIKAKREALNLTQEQAAIKAGYSGRAAWNNLESGRQSNPSLDRAIAIADVLGCTLDELAGRRAPRAKK